MAGVRESGVRESGGAHKLLHASCMSSGVEAWAMSRVPCPVSGLVATLGVDGTAVSGLLLASILCRMCTRLSTR